MFLHKCCFLTEDDMSIPSFERPCSALSRASNAGYELQRTLDKEIIFIKKCPKTWLENEDEGSSFEDCSSDGNSVNKSLRSENTPRLRKMSASEIRYLKSCTNESTCMHKKFKNRCRRLPSRTSTYTFKSKTEESSMGKALDWIMACFWNCSLGCQQLPTLNM